MYKIQNAITPIILITAIVASIGIATFIQNADAGPTKIIIDWGWYKCSELETNIVCIPWSLISKRTEVEGWWHKRFGKHPHGVKWVFVDHDPVHEWVLSCSQCNPGFE